MQLGYDVLGMWMELRKTDEFTGAGFEHRCLGFGDIDAEGTSFLK
jgi:hypothetical protein